jgi:transcriptional regulator with XRE-family HTH domain
MHRPARRSSIPGLAHQIRAARQQAGLSQTDLARQLGIRQSSVGQWERGATTPTLGMFRRLVAVLGPWPLLQALLPAGTTILQAAADQQADQPDGPCPNGSDPQEEVRPIRKVVSKLTSYGPDAADHPRSSWQSAAPGPSPRRHQPATATGGAFEPAQTSGSTLSRRLLRNLCRGRLTEAGGQAECSTIG